MRRQWREGAEQFDVIQQAVAESGRGVPIVPCDVLEDLKEVFPRPRGDNYFEHRLASSLRTSSRGIPKPASN